MTAWLTPLLLGILANPMGQAHEWPNKTLMLVAEPTMLVLGDPGPGWVPEGEPEGSQIRQSFYYHGMAGRSSISMVLVEVDCTSIGKWRVRANTDVDVTETGSVKLARQSLANRSSPWTIEGDSESLGLAVWKNTCQGDTSGGTIGNLTPWAGAQLWKQHQQVKVEDLDETP